MTSLNPAPKKHSTVLRVWHWLNALTIIALLITVLINGTLLKKAHPAKNGKADAPKTEVAASADKHEEHDADHDHDRNNTAKPEISDAQTPPPVLSADAPKPAKDAKDPIRALRHQVWDVHTKLGFLLIGLFIVLVIGAFTDAKSRKLLAKLKNSLTLYKTDDANRSHHLHHLLVKSSYVVFYLLLSIMVITGFCLAFDDDIPVLKQHFIKEIHGFTMYLILAFVIAHIVGVFVAELRKDKGIVSDMINGGTEA